MINETFSEMRGVLLTAIEHAERDLEEQIRQTQLSEEAHAQRLLTDTRQCALDLDRELRELVQHLEHVRANVEAIRERLTTCLDQLPEPAPDEPKVASAQPAAPPSSEDTVRLLRAALETLSRNTNGESTSSA